MLHVCSLMSGQKCALKSQAQGTFLEKQIRAESSDNQFYLT